jgi:aspartyl protease family protein
MKLNNKFLLKVLIFGLILLIASKILPLFDTQSTIINTSLIPQILFFVILIFFLVRGYITNRRETKSIPITNILLWLMIFVMLIIGYAFRFELESFKKRILAVIIPSYSWTNEQGELVIARNQDGHFYLDATTTDNHKIKFLIDTGATDIAITKNDAIKLGFNLSNLKYTKQYNTANGTSFAAPVRIKQLTIGKKTFYNLEAHISSGGLDISLLGMSLIGEFKNFKITNDLLIMHY